MILIRTGAKANTFFAQTVQEAPRPRVERGREYDHWSKDSWVVQFPNPELWRFILRVMRDGCRITVDVTSDGAGLVSHAGSALLAQVADRVGLTRSAFRASSSGATATIRGG